MTSRGNVREYVTGCDKKAGIFKSLTVTLPQSVT